MWTFQAHSPVRSPLPTMKEVKKCKTKLTSPDLSQDFMRGY